MKFIANARQATVRSPMAVTPGVKAIPPGVKRSMSPIVGGSSIATSPGYHNRQKKKKKKMAAFVEQPLSPVKLKKGQSFDRGIDELEEEEEGFYEIEDTTICQTSHVAAMQAASIVCQGVDVVMSGRGHQRGKCGWPTKKKTGTLKKC